MKEKYEFYNGFQSGDLCHNYAMHVELLCLSGEIIEPLLLELQTELYHFSLHADKEYDNITYRKLSDVSLVLVCLLI